MTRKATSDLGRGLDGRTYPARPERVRTQVADYETSGGVEGATLEGRPVVILTSVAEELADGLFTVNGQTAFAPRFDWAALGVHGTVLHDGESLDSRRGQGGG